MVALSYSSMRGFGSVHPTIGELRAGYVGVYIPNLCAGSEPEESVYLGEVQLTGGRSTRSARMSALDARCSISVTIYASDITNRKRSPCHPGV